MSHSQHFQKSDQRRVGIDWLLMQFQIALLQEEATVIRKEN